MVNHFPTFVMRKRINHLNFVSTGPESDSQETLIPALSL